MGNQLSITSSIHLSKSKTNNTLPSLPLLTDEPVSASSRYTDLSIEQKSQSRNILISPAQTEVDSALGLPRDGNNTCETTPQVGGLQCSKKTRPSSRSIFRSNSLSWLRSKSDPVAKSALQEAGGSLNATAQADITLALDEAADISNGHTTSVSERGLGRSASLVNLSSSSALTRRRSLLLTPGVATRHVLPEDRRQTRNSWKAHQPDPGKETNWKTTPKRTYHTQNSDISNTVENIDESSTPRAETPGELNYSHLGNLRLGSLVITNGAASPASSMVTAKATRQNAAENDYFLLSKHSPSPSKTKVTRRYTRGANPSYTSFKADASIHGLRPCTDETSPTRQEQIRSRVDSGTLPSATQMKGTSAKKSVAISKIASSTASDHCAKLYRSSFEKLRKEFIEEQSGKITSTDKSVTKAADPLISDRANRSEPAHTTKLTSPINSSKRFYTQSTEEQDLGQSRRPMLRSIDSGYSSGCSLRTAGSRRLQRNRLTKSVQRNKSLPTKDASTKAASFIVPDEPVYNSPMSDSGCPSEPLPNIEQEFSRPPLSWLSNRGALSCATSPVLDKSPSIKTPHSIVSKASFESILSSNKKRFCRRRSSQPELPVVQTRQSISNGTVPRIPDSVQHRFTQRLSHDQGMECLIHTYPTKEDALATIPRFDTNTMDHNQFANVESDRPIVSFTRQKSLSLLQKRSPSTKKRIEVEVDMPVSDSMGSDLNMTMYGSTPYDAAMLSSTSSNAPLTGRRNFGDALPRAKSMTSMDAASATKLTRRRSKDRNLPEGEMQPWHHLKRNQGALQDPLTASKRSSVQQRRRSFHNLRLEVGEATASKRRPPGYDEDIPPVPPIDHSKILIPGPATAMPRLETQRDTEAGSNIVSSPESWNCDRAASKVITKKGRAGESSLQSDVTWEHHVKVWSQRRRLISEGLRKMNEPAEFKASTTHACTNSQRQSSAASGAAIWSRNTGGTVHSRDLEHNANHEFTDWRSQCGDIMSSVSGMIV